MTDRELLELLLKKMDHMDGRFGEVQDEIGGLKGEISGVKGEISGVKDEIGGVKGEIGEIKGEIREIKEKVEKIEHTQNIIFEQTAFLTEYRTENEFKITELAKKVDNNTTDINLIKKLLA